MHLIVMERADCCLGVSLLWVQAGHQQFGPLACGGRLAYPKGLCWVLGHRLCLHPTTTPINSAQDSESSATKLSANAHGTVLHQGQKDNDSTKGVLP